VLEVEVNVSHQYRLLSLFKLEVHCVVLISVIEWMVLRLVRRDHRVVVTQRHLVIWATSFSSYPWDSVEYNGFELLDYWDLDYIPEHSFEVVNIPQLAGLTYSNSRRKSLQSIELVRIIHCVHKPRV
jgi:hypothetical protein